MKNVFIVLMSCVVSIVLLEGVGRFIVDNASLTAPLKVVSSAPIQASRPNKMLHPYLGFTIRPDMHLTSFLAPERVRRMYGRPGVPDWLDSSTNSDGFWSPHDIPYFAETKNAYIVGIFGGSVGKWFAVQGAKPFAKKLRSLPALKGRKIVILNFSNGGYKQPQQLQVLTYALTKGQKFDLVVSVDGFNELMIPMTNNRAFSPDMPNAPGIIGMQNYMANQSSNLIRKNFAYREKYRSSLTSSNKTNSVILHYYYKSMARQYEKRIAELDKTLANQRSETDYVVLMHNAIKQSEPELINSAVDIWVNASIAMQGLAQQFGFDYLHVLQPNQYYTERTFSKAESEIAFRPGATYDRLVNLVPKFYPALILGGRRIAGRGIKFMDATTIFDQEKRTVYADNCCHYNDLGNSILVDHVFKLLPKH